ncbi:hypothetical protein FS837_010898 [Tulasnella sp. UAMH 9824]|nr:hypothetical protein FS837_010898 [Tulasnella sp. UAMH 9824]
MAFAGQWHCLCELHRVWIPRQLADCFQDSPLSLEAPVVVCVHKETLLFGHNGKSGWFAASETQHFFSNGRTVELLTFGNQVGGDAVQAGPDPAFDYIGTISIHGLYAVSVKGRPLSEILREEYLRLTDEAQRTLGDVKECSWLGFTVVGSKGVITVDARSLAIPLPPASSSSLQSSAKAPSPSQLPTPFLSTSSKIETRGFRKSLFFKYADRLGLFGRVMRNSEEEPQCPLHTKIGIIAADNQHVTGTGEDQATRRGKRSPADDDGSANLPTNENKGPGTQSSIRPPLPAIKSESTDAELPLEYLEVPKWRPGLNIMKTSRPSTDPSKTSSGQGPSSGCSEATSRQAVILAEAHSNNSDNEDPPAKKQERELSTEDQATSADPIELSVKKPRPEVP